MLAAALKALGRDDTETRMGSTSLSVVPAGGSGCCGRGQADSSEASGSVDGPTSGADGRVGRLRHSCGGGGGAVGWIAWKT